MMKRLVLLLLVGLGATAGQSGGCSTCSHRQSEACNSSGRGQSACCESPAYRMDFAGPEVTGNYAQAYLYSATTGKTYADPMYYHALSALRRWHEIKPSARRSPSKQYVEVKADSR